DPGFRAVRAATEAGHRVSVIPGPSAVLTALAASGIAPDRFTFGGFPPRREGRRAGALEPLAAEERTMVFFESPRRTAATLASMAEAFGGARPAAVARELTKTYEEIRRGSLEELVAWAEEGEVLGEVVIVVAGAAPVQARAEDLVDGVLVRVAAGERLKTAAKEVARAHAGVGASERYDLALRRRPPEDDPGGPPGTTKTPAQRPGSSCGGCDRSGCARPTDLLPLAGSQHVDQTVPDRLISCRSRARSTSISQRSR